MCYKHWIYVCNNRELKDKILNEAHRSQYTVKPRNTKMYCRLRGHHWWNVCSKLFDMSIGQGRVLEVSWNVATITDTQVGMGAYSNGLHRWFPKKKKRKKEKKLTRCYMVIVDQSTKSSHFMANK